MESKLGDVARVQSGFAFKSKDWQDDGVPVVKIQNVRNGRVDLDGCSFVSCAIADAATKFELSRGDVLVTMTGEIGSIGTVRTDRRVMLNQRVGRLEIVRKDTSREFVALALQHPALKLRMESIAYGAAQPNISPALIESLPIWIPSPEIQRDIVSRLTAFDDLIENNRRRIEILEEMALLLYREWFVHFRYRGHEDVEMVDSELGPIPEGWEARTLGDSAKWLSGGTPSTKVAEYWDGEIPWITSGSLKSFLLSDSERRLTPSGVDSGSRIVPRDSTIFVVRGMSLASEFRHGIADVPLAFGQDCKALVAHEGLESLVLALAVSSMATEIQAMVEFAAHGTGKLSTDRIQALYIPIAPAEVQLSFVAMVGPMRELGSNLRRQNAVLRDARDLLLPRLVSGALDVSDLDVGTVGV